MEQSRTTDAVQRYLDELAGVRGDAPAEPVVRALLARAVGRLHQLCAGMLYRSYPRLARGPLNLDSDELLGAVVERLLKAMRDVRPPTVRQFFALVNQHMRWELNDLARRLDAHGGAHGRPVELRESAVAAPVDPDRFGEGSSGDPAHQTPNTVRILAEIDRLPADEREAFTLVRIQGLTHPEAADVMGVSTKTVQRRVTRSLLLLQERLGGGAVPPPADP